MKKIHSTSNDFILLAGLLSATALAHISAVQNYFVADTWVFVVPRSLAETFEYFFKSIIPHEWEAYWLRPIPMFTFWFDNIIWPDTIWGPHITNILLHVLNVWLIWLIIRFIYTNAKHEGPESGYRLPALIACLVYGLHPLNVGAVAWVAARFDVMSLTIGLAGLYAWFRWDAGARSFKGMLLISFIFLCAILSKEQSVIFPAVCIGASYLRKTRDRANAEKYANFIFINGLTLALYFIYRVVVFSGMGGYVREAKGLNPAIPFKFLASILYPFSQAFHGWTVSLPFILSSAVVAALIGYAFRTPRISAGKADTVYILTAEAVFILGLATTIPHAGMTLESILGHSESRFTLISIAGLSLMLGTAAINLNRSVRTYKIILILLLSWSILSAWRTSVQIQAWHHAGEIAQSIVNDTVCIAPDPPKGSTLLYFQIPLNNDQHAYIFGIGLKEAVLNAYPGRDDLTVLGRARKSDLANADPARDYVFAFNSKIGRIERLTPESPE